MYEEALQIVVVEACINKMNIRSNFNSDKNIDEKSKCFDITFLLLFLTSSGYLIRIRTVKLPFQFELAYNVHLQSQHHCSCEVYGVVIKIHRLICKSGII